MHDLTTYMQSLLKTVRRPTVDKFRLKWSSYRAPAENIDV